MQVATKVPERTRESSVPADFSSFFTAMLQEPVHVILGAQGSGTNLLSKVLRTAFGFSVVHDRSLVFNAAVRVHRNQTPRTISRELQRVYNSLFPSPLRKRFMLKRYCNQARNYTGIQEYLQTIPVRTAQEFASFFYSYHAFVNQSQHRALKSDDLWESMGYVPQILPRRKYILLVRDPRDNALSILNKPWGPCEIHAASRYIERRMHAYRDEVDREDAESITIRYEDLLNDPRTVVAVLSEFLQLAPANDLDRRLDALEIRQGNQSKWKRLSAADLDCCESVLRNEIIRFGYTLGGTNGPELGSIARARRVLCDVRRRIPQKLRRRLQRLKG